MEPMEKDEDKKPFDRFELVTAVLLGLAAIGAAVAGQQSGQWGGRQLEAFSAANSLTTKAATQYNEDTIAVNADYTAVAAAKQNILEARDAVNAQDRERHLDMASYQYTNQMSRLGYEAMGLPINYYVEDEDEKQPEQKAPAGGPAPAANTGQAATAEPAVEPAAETGAGEDAAPAEQDPEEAAHTALQRDIPDEVLLASLQHELDDEYIDKALGKGTQMFAAADKKFEEGRQANDNGDKFDLVVVFFTVALFFGGLGLVFKTQMRWGFFFTGLAVFLVSAVYMVTLHWA